MSAIGYGLIGGGVLLIYAGLTGRSAIVLVRDALRGSSGRPADAEEQINDPGAQALRDLRNRTGPYAAQTGMTA